MSATTKKGDRPASRSPKRSARTTTATRVGPDLRRDQRDRLTEGRQALARRYHPDDARRVWMAARIDRSPARWRDDALDLAVAVRMADGMRRRDALAAVEAAAARLDARSTDWVVQADIGAATLLDLYAPDPLPARRLPAPVAMFGVLS